MQKNNSIKTLFLISFLFFNSTISRAADGDRISLFESDAYLKIGGGGSISQTTGLGYEASFGYRLLKRYPSIFLGLAWSVSPVASTQNPLQPVSQGITDTLSAYTFSILHQFSDENNGWVAGLRAGYGVRSLSRGLVVAPVVQYHYGLSDEFTVGLETEVLGFWVSGFTPRNIAVLGQAVVQYWF